MGSNEDTFVRFHKALAEFSATKLNSCSSTLQQDTIQEDCNENENEKLNRFVRTPPIERFLGIPASIRKRLFFESLHEGNVVRGKVEYKWIQGLIMKIESVEYGKNRWVKDLNLKAQYHINDNKQPGSSRRSSESSLDFEIGDKVRAVVCSANANEQKIAISFQQEMLPDYLRTVELGIIEDDFSTDSDDLEDDESYVDYLRRSPVFSNPGCVQNLTSLLKINTEAACSFLKVKQSSQIPPEEVAERLRENQSSKWSLEMTAIGIKAFKGGQFEEALKYIDQALQLYPTNVEALVARGALKANKTNLKDAVTDFREALSIKPTHRNGQKYLTETLVTLAKQYEKDRQWKDASRCYKDVLQVNPDHEQSSNRLQQIQFLLAQQMLVGEKSSCYSATKNISNVTTKSSCSAGSVSKLKYLLEETTRQKKAKKIKKIKKVKKKRRDKRRRRSRTSSTSSSPSSTDSTDSEATESATEGHDDNDSDEWVEKEATLSEVSLKKESKSYLLNEVREKQPSYEADPPTKTASSKRHSRKQVSNKEVHTHSKERDFISLHSVSTRRTSKRPLTLRKSDKTFSPKRKISSHRSPGPAYVDDRSSSKDAGMRLSKDEPNIHHTADTCRKEYTNLTSGTSQKANKAVSIDTKKLQHFSDAEMGLVAQLLGNKDTTTSKRKPGQAAGNSLPTDSQKDRFKDKINRDKDIDSSESEV